MPAPYELPQVLADLSRRQALEISVERFRHDVAQLIKAIEKIQNITPREVIAGCWVDTNKTVTTFFRQMKDRVIGFYSFGDQGKVGLYYGFVNGNTCDLQWYWFDKSFKGRGLVTISEDSNFLSVDHWSGDDPNYKSHIDFQFAAYEPPSWLDSQDFEPFEAWLVGDDLSWPGGDL